VKAKSSRRVLVADDEPLLLRLMRDILHPAYAVEATESGREVLQRHRESRYDALILDSSLSSLSGLEIVARVRDRGDRVPIILTTHEPPSGRLDPFAFAYKVSVLRKPFGARDLHEALERLVGH
jgi:two-component system alkaline phosphatase synthesis response regulator PhoP